MLLSSFNKFLFSISFLSPSTDPMRLCHRFGFFVYENLGFVSRSSVCPWYLFYKFIFSFPFIILHSYFLPVRLILFRQPLVSETDKFMPKLLHLCPCQLKAWWLLVYSRCVDIYTHGYVHKLKFLKVNELPKLGPICHSHCNIHGRNKIQFL